MFALLAALAAVSPGHACPTLATGETSQLSFDVAQVAIVRQGTRTTFSVSINPFGDPQDFALVMPVPEVLDETEVKTLDGAIFARLDGATAPRHVSDAGCGGGGGGYTATDSADTDGDTDTDTDGGGGDEPEVPTVEVEAEYLVGDYEVVLLSATEAGGLYDWLDANGYHLPAGAEERLGEYIEAGQFFLGAKVAADAARADGTPLPPLQVSYDSEVFAIPLRLATLNSPGEQDMVIYALVAGEEGAVAISNYPEFELPDTCIWTHESRDFGAFYEDWFRRHWESVGDAGWTQEFTGEPNTASPTTGIYLTAQDVRALGMDLSESHRYALTRLRMRYTPEQAVQDLSLYASGLTGTVVTPFADDYDWNHDCRDYCEFAPYGAEPDAGSDDGGGGRGCSAVAGAASAALALLGLAVVRERRSARA